MRLSKAAERAAKVSAKRKVKILEDKENIKLLKKEQIYIDWIRNNYQDLNFTDEEIIAITSIHNDFMVKESSTDVPEDNIITPLGLEMVEGFNHLYAKPDCLKTTISINIAECFLNKGEKVIYLDGENKLSSDWLPKNKDIVYIPGTANSSGIMRKLAQADASKLVIIDTIVAVSRYSEMLRSLIKHYRLSGTYCLLLNQTRFHKFGDVHAGEDIIDEFSRRKYHIVSKKIINKNAFLKVKNSLTGDYHQLVFTENDVRLYKYNHTYTVMLNLKASGDLKKVGDVYIYNDKSFSKKEIIKYLENINISWKV